MYQDELYCTAVTLYYKHCQVTEPWREPDQPNWARSFPRSKNVWVLENVNGRLAVVNVKTREVKP